MPISIGNLWSTFRWYVKIVLSMMQSIHSFDSVDFLSGKFSKYQKSKTITMWGLLNIYTGSRKWFVGEVPFRIYNNMQCCIFEESDKYHVIFQKCKSQESVWRYHWYPQNLTFKGFRHMSKDIPFCFFLLKPNTPVHTPHGLIYGRYLSWIPGSHHVGIREMRWRWTRLIVGFQPLMVISPTASWIRWCMQVYACELMWTSLVWAERSSPDSFWVPSHRAVRWVTKRITICRVLIQRMWTKLSNQHVSLTSGHNVCRRLRGRGCPWICDIIFDWPPELIAVACSCNVETLTCSKHVELAVSFTAVYPVVGEPLYSILTDGKLIL